MTRHQIEHICWREISWRRPFSMESVWEALTHLSALSPRGAVIWECRGKNGQAVHLLGADRMYIGKIERTLRAHGNIQFREVPDSNRTPINVSRQLKISRPVLSLNTNLT